MLQGDYAKIVNFTFYFIYYYYTILFSILLVPHFSSLEKKKC